MILLSSVDLQELGQVCSNFTNFCDLTYGRSYIPNPIVKNQLTPKLSRITAEKYKGHRLLVNMPPRHGKTDTISIRYSAWRLLFDPKQKGVVITYGDELAEEIGVAVRNIIEEWGKYFGVYISPHTRKKTSLKFCDYRGHDTGGSFQCLSYKGSLTGKGFDFIIIDDLIKNSEEALSKAYNKKIVSIYKSTIYTRLESNSDIIVLSTRWSVDDLSGYLLKSSTEKWDTLILKAIDHGQALWPDKFSFKRLEEIKKELGEFWFNSEYQQTPEILTEGILINRETLLTHLWKTREVKPAYHVIGIDLAGAGRDNTALTSMFRLSDSRHIVNQHIKIGSSSPEPEILNFILKLHDQYPVNEILLEQEPGASPEYAYKWFKKELKPAIMKGIYVNLIKVTESKYMRAQPMALSIKRDETYFNEKLPYLEELFNQFLYLNPSKTIMKQFPSPDLADSTTLCFNRITELFEGGLRISGGAL